jgi:hypothetical protein
VFGVAAFDVSELVLKDTLSLTLRGNLSQQRHRLDYDTSERVIEAGKYLENDSFVTVKIDMSHPPARTREQGEFGRVAFKLKYLDGDALTRIRAFMNSNNIKVLNIPEVGGGVAVGQAPHAATFICHLFQFVGPFLRLTDLKTIP